MNLVVTIDTEEDNWARYSATDNPVENIERIVALQELFDEFGVTPTYLVTYPVANNPKSVEILKRILDEGKCEIGMHCHPWNTPPFEEKKDILEYDTMLCNLPEKLQHEKLTSLHEAIQINFGITSVSFRAGRWGFGPSVAASISGLGYRVDTSVTPYVSWKKYNGPDFSDFSPEVFRFNPQLPAQKNENGALLEVPATIGFLQSNFRLCHRLMKAMNGHVARKFRMIGILWYLRLLNKVWLSPEQADADLMIKLAKRMKRNNYSVLNLTLHSTSLMAGLSPFVRCKDDENALLQKVRDFLIFCRQAGWESQTLSRAGMNF